MELPGLRAFRLRRLLTQADLASRVNMTPASISRIETGATKARISTVRRIAEALDADPGDLLSKNGQYPTSQNDGQDT